MPAFPRSPAEIWHRQNATTQKVESDSGRGQIGFTIQSFDRARRWVSTGGMKRGLALLLCLVGCSEDQTVPTAYLSAIHVISPDGQSTDLLEPMDAAALPHSPLSRLQATFSALLDPSKLHDLSGNMPRPGQGVAKLVWHRPTGDVERPLASVYNPARTALGAPAPTVSFTLANALPAEAALTLVLEPQRLVNKSGVPYVGARQVDFETAAFEVDVAAPSQPVGPDFVLRMSFNTVPAAFAPQAIVVVDGGGAAVAIEVTQDPAAPLAWFISPLGQAVPWARGTYTLRLDGTTLTDTHGVALAGPMGPWSFTVEDGRGGGDAGGGGDVGGGG